MYNKYMAVNQLFTTNLKILKNNCAKICNIKTAYVSLQARYKSLR